MELARLKRENAELKMEKEILKKAFSVLCQGVAVRYAFIKAMRLTYPIPILCHVLEVSRSGYYAWLNRKPSRHAIEEVRLELEIKAAHRRTRGTFGPERLQKYLLSYGIKAGICRIRRLRKMLGIRCKQIRRYKATTDSSHTLSVAENILEQKFEVSSPNKIWVSDITYIPTDEGWLYLAAHKDLFNGEIVGYAAGSRITKEITIQSLLMAIKRRQPEGGLIHHSDRGIQYCSDTYQRLLNQFHIQPSMSRKGNCYDNAPMESFFGILKNELIYQKRYATREEAIREITEYIEIFYNRERIQEKLKVSITC
jgi:putative transposase